MEVKLVHTVNHTVAFLRMAAIELRRIAEHVSAVDADLGHVARQLDLEAEELTQQLPPGQRLPER